MLCPHCQAADVPVGAIICPKCGVSPNATPGAAGSDGFETTLVPYRNPQALTAYYLGLFGSLLSCIPLVGVIGFGMSIASLIFGLKGRKAAIADPRIKGTAHAWFGIVGGILGIVFGLLVQGTMIVVLISAAMQGKLR
ncbi:MAG: zinc ribbon domain-containing protein [Isosphaeraceae bacterium]